MDLQDQIKCVMNEQLCEKIFKMSAHEGFKKFYEDCDGFKKKIN
jgi:hypothetical protein